MENTIPEIISRKDARISGLRYYFTGKPCRKGHISLRLVSNFNCRDCEKIKSKKNRHIVEAWRKNNSERVKQTRKDYYSKNREEIIEKTKTWQAENSEKLRQKNSEYYRKHKTRLIKEQNARNAKRRAAKLRATPFWSETEKIKHFYLNCPKGYHVDHIVPLQGRNVCGLHVLSNLQYLPALENIAKGNRI